ncbi:hypothetical protein [Sandarakinorhabdus cyanobacteriorum]|uniref:hypothetical protein n=1 Tax=Sandarakinorhabdus cyanobacteriorum TaxID=1981098 RepID=UPI0010542037|nr:hypothetical protein [Sandarakinorhabdus cyanobacteriorum]
MEIRAADLLRAMQDGMRLQGDDTGAFSFLPFALPILQARFDSGEADNAGAPATTALDPAKFEHFADRAHRAFLGEPGIIMPHVRVETLLEAIGMACDRLAAEPGGRGAPDAATRLNMQSGLQLVGVRICASPAVADLLQASPGALRLSNARLPFSLRLIGCVIETPLALSNCQLVTLDLSGSALRGLDATFFFCQWQCSSAAHVSGGTCGFCRGDRPWLFRCRRCHFQTTGHPARCAAARWRPRHAQPQPGAGGQ